jgi:hypothetical protein
MTYTEKRVFKKETKLPFPLLIDKASEKKAQLHVRNKEGEVLYKSEPFFKREAKKLYTTNAEFKQWFDYAVDLSCFERISNGMFKIPEEVKDTNVEFVPDEMDIELEQQLNKKEEIEAQDNQELPEPPEDLGNNISEQQETSEYDEEFPDNPDLPPVTHPRDNMPLEDKEAEEIQDPDMSDYQSTF